MSMKGLATAAVTYIDAVYDVIQRGGGHGDDRRHSVLEEQAVNRLRT